MAKFVGFIGTISGKVGTTVFTKGEKGLSYGRSYQPQVQNPKTEAQQDQRAKMNLVGRLSQITPKNVLVGMGGTGRARRSAFNSNLLQVATIDRTAPGTIKAIIEPEDIIFSRGGEVLNAQVSTPVAVTATNVTLGLALSDAALAGKYGERIVVLAVDPDDKGGYSLVRSFDVLFASTEAVSVTVPFGMSLESETTVAVYRLPYVLTAEGMNMVTEGLASEDENVIAKALLSTGAVRGWGNSYMEAKEVFRQA